MDSTDLNAGLGYGLRYFVEGTSFVQRVIDGVMFLSFWDLEFILGSCELVLKKWEADSKLCHVGGQPGCIVGPNSEFLTGAMPIYIDDDGNSSVIVGASAIVDDFASNGDYQVLTS
ncbi:unnamed protein product [Notodromas monacha]|uniref:Uncharacterized protein n=1 Tax=Notodromas monacha TaxID=399045 RepID=A0A7R9BLC9_9CRUS|nr:unnamed protein product [Notodromas monacha]CAG0917607.1 unnamed protein product [Notodromas monacha]